MVIMFALAAAVLYGSADFLGGAASRHSRALSVASLSVPVGALVMLAAAVASDSQASGSQAPTAGLGWAIAAGIFGAIGLMVFYAGLAAGPMSVVAPVSALVSTVLPVSVALASGERPGPAVYLGALICLTAIVLVSMDGGAPGRPAGPRGAAR